VTLLPQFNHDTCTRITGCIHISAIHITTNEETHLTSDMRAHIEITSADI